VTSPADIALLFARLSLFAVGGANAVIPEMQRHFVDGGALDPALFASLVAFAQAAPGPNAMIVGLVGFHVDGGRGAVAATLGFCGPPSLLTLLVGRVWSRLKASGAGDILVRGLAPLTVGLVLASAWALVRGQGPSPLPVAITVISGVVVLFRPNLGLPVLLLSAALAALFTP
jgi:chromate transporter